MDAMKTIHKIISYVRNNPVKALIYGLLVINAVMILDTLVLDETLRSIDSVAQREQVTFLIKAYIGHFGAYLVSAATLIGITSRFTEKQ